MEYKLKDGRVQLDEQLDGFLDNSSRGDECLEEVDTGVIWREVFDFEYTDTSYTKSPSYYFPTRAPGCFNTQIS